MKKEPPRQILLIAILIAWICIQLLILNYLRINQGKIKTAQLKNEIIRSKDYQIINRIYLKAPNGPIVKTNLYGVEIDLTLYKIIEGESGFNPKAVNKQFGRVGGMGLAQLIPKTVKYCEKKLKKKIDPFDPKDNLECAKWLYENEGTIHWGTEDTWWGSYEKWSKEI